MTELEVGDKTSYFSEHLESSLAVLWETSENATS